MRINLQDHVIAGVLFLQAALLVLAIWFIYLFVAMPYPESIMKSAMIAIEYAFSSENEQRLGFVWLAALPIACTALGLAYLLNLSRNKKAALALLALAVVLAAVTIFIAVWPLALFVALPIVWGYRCAYPK